MSEADDIRSTVRDLQFASISDTEDTIRATDAKASIALVVHSFLFAGLLTTTRELGELFSGASCTFKVLVVAFLLAIGACFLASVAQLLRCVVPAPKDTFPKGTDGIGVFFLSGDADAVSGKVTGLPPVSGFAESLSSLTNAQIESELAAEQIKVSAIRLRKVALAGSGLKLLGVEVVLGVAYLVAIGIHAISWSHVRVSVLVGTWSPIWSRTEHFLGDLRELR